MVINDGIIKDCIPTLRNYLNDKSGGKLSFSKITFDIINVKSGKVLIDIDFELNPKNIFVLANKTKIALNGVFDGTKIIDFEVTLVMEIGNGSKFNIKKEHDIKFNLDTKKVL